ncbi:alpha/beta fold hydrolase [Flindersiella endophytica]
MTTTRLSVPGADLYYEVRGSGPALLLIPGSNGDAGFFDGLATALADRYTVVTYDRRGFSRSPLTEPFGSAWSEIHADDARRLLATVTDGPALVFGSSAGAIIGLDLLTRQPDLLRGLVAHEPPLAEILPDAAAWRTFFAEVYDTYRRGAAGEAMQRFMAGIGTANAGRPAHLDPELGRRAAGNVDFFFQHELREATGHQPDLAALDALRNQVVLAGGAGSRDHFPYRPNVVLAARWGRAVLDFPGDHIGYWSQPDAFATTLAGAFESLTPSETRRPG